jgi:predicted NAD/FAD-binding protein
MTTMARVLSIAVTGAVLALTVSVLLSARKDTLFFEADGTQSADFGQATG